MQLPAQYQPAELDRLGRLGFSHPAHAAIARELVSIRRADWASDPIVTLLTSAPVELASIIQDAAAATLPAIGADAEARYARGVINRALVNVIAREKTELLALLRRLDTEAQADQVVAVQKGLVDLEAERRFLQES